VVHFAPDEEQGEIIEHLHFFETDIRNRLTHQTDPVPHTFTITTDQHKQAQLSLGVTRGK
jgi:hypothetical protein